MHYPISNLEEVAQRAGGWPKNSAGRTMIYYNPDGGYLMTEDVIDASNTEIHWNCPAIWITDVRNKISADALQKRVDEIMSYEDKEEQ